MVRQHPGLNGREFEQLQETVKDRQTQCAAVHGVTKSYNLAAEQQQQKFQHEVMDLRLIKTGYLRNQIEFMQHFSGKRERETLYIPLIRNVLSVVGQE